MIQSRSPAFTWPATVARFGIQSAQYPPHDKLVLIAPLNSDPAQWNKIKYVDAHTGKVYRLHDRSKERRANKIVEDDSGYPIPQLYGNVLFAVQNHHEAKSAGGD